MHEVSLRRDFVYTGLNELFGAGTRVDAAGRATGVRSPAEGRLQRGFMAKRKKTEQRLATQPEATQTVADAPVLSPAAAGTTVAAPASGRASVDRDQIARRAYELYLARGGAHGHAEEDWLSAERELAEQVARSH